MIIEIEERERDISREKELERQAVTKISRVHD